MAQEQKYLRYSLNTVHKNAPVSLILGDPGANSRDDAIFLGEN